MKARVSSEAGATVLLLALVVLSWALSLGLLNMSDELGLRGPTSPANRAKGTLTWAVATVSVAGVCLYLGSLWRRHFGHAKTWLLVGAAIALATAAIPTVLHLSDFLALVLVLLGGGIPLMAPTATERGWRPKAMAVGLLGFVLMTFAVWAALFLE